MITIIINLQLQQHLITKFAFDNLSFLTALKKPVRRNLNVLVRIFNLTFFSFLLLLNLLLLRTNKKKHSTKHANVYEPEIGFCFCIFIIIKIVCLDIIIARLDYCWRENIIKIILIDDRRPITFYKLIVCSFICVLAYSARMPTAASSCSSFAKLENAINLRRPKINQINVNTFIFRWSICFGKKKAFQIF